MSDYPYKDELVQQVSDDEEYGPEFNLMNRRSLEFEQPQPLSLMVRGESQELEEQQQNTHHHHRPHHTQQQQSSSLSHHQQDSQSATFEGGSASHPNTHHNNTNTNTNNNHNNSNQRGFQPLKISFAPPPSSPLGSQQKTTASKLSGSCADDESGDVFGFQDSPSLHHPQPAGYAYPRSSPRLPAIPNNTDDDDFAYIPEELNTSNTSLSTHSPSSSATSLPSPFSSTGSLNSSIYSGSQENLLFPFDKRQAFYTRRPAESRNTPSPPHELFSNGLNNLMGLSTSHELFPYFEERGVSGIGIPSPNSSTSTLPSAHPAMYTSNSSSSSSSLSRSPTSSPSLSSKHLSPRSSASSSRGELSFSESSFLPSSSMGSLHDEHPVSSPEIPSRHPRPAVETSEVNEPVRKKSRSPTKEKHSFRSFVENRRIYDGFLIRPKREFEENSTISDPTSIRAEGRVKVWNDGSRIRWKIECLEKGVCTNIVDSLTAFASWYRLAIEGNEKYCSRKPYRELVFIDWKNRCVWKSGDDFRAGRNGYPFRSESDAAPLTEAHPFTDSSGGNWSSPDQRKLQRHRSKSLVISVSEESTSSTGKQKKRRSPSRKEPLPSEEELQNSYRHALVNSSSGSLTWPSFRTTVETAYERPNLGQSSPLPPRELTSQQSQLSHSSPAHLAPSLERQFFHTRTHSNPH